MIFMNRMIQKFAKAASTNAIFILVCILLITELLSINWYFQAVCVVLVILCIVILAFRNSKVSSKWQMSELNQRQRDDMLVYFSREYFEVYVVDLNRGSYEIIRSAERRGDDIKRLTGDFKQLMERALVTWTKPPYKEKFNQLVDMEGIKRRFSSGEKKIEFIYKSYDEKWKRLECFPVPEYGSDNEKMIFALRDYTEEMQIRTK